MRYRSYFVRYAKTGEVFEQRFTPDQNEECCLVNGAPEEVALRLTNEWNRQNATSGFTYWIE